MAYLIVDLIVIISYFYKKSFISNIFESILSFFWRDNVFFLVYILVEYLLKSIFFSLMDINNIIIG